MDFFEISDQALLWRNHGETLCVQPWGPDSLRAAIGSRESVGDNQ